MQHHDVIVFALQVGAMLAAALGCGQIMRALRQPAVLGELLGGILLGPTVLGALAPHAYAWLFPATGTTAVGRDAMLKIGMLFFMFADFAAHIDLPLVLIVFVIACAGKIGGAWLGGMPRQEALAVGFGMNARGAMEMILASVALEYQVIDQRIFVALITMALTTSMLSGPMMQRLLQKA
jgi:Kef-type K+ transport system membrane component KefB